MEKKKLTERKWFAKVGFKKIRMIPSFGNAVRNGIIQHKPAGNISKNLTNET